MSIVWAKEGMWTWSFAPHVQTLYTFSNKLNCDFKSLAQFVTRWHHTLSKQPGPNKSNTVKSPCPQQELPTQMTTSDSNIQAKRRQLTPLRFSHKGFTFLNSFLKHFALQIIVWEFHYHIFIFTGKKFILCLRANNLSCLCWLHSKMQMLAGFCSTFK